MHFDNSYPKMNVHKFRSVEKARKIEYEKIRNLG